MIRQLGMLITIMSIVFNLTACVESETSLLKNAQPFLGQRFEVHLYEDLVEGKAGNFHGANYSWSDGRYVRAAQIAGHILSFVAIPLEGNDYIVETTDGPGELFDYWIGRKLIDGVYLLFRIDETDADSDVRNVACVKNLPQGICLIETYDHLIELARATAAKPVHNPALGVIVAN
jgi:hypothetical protein